MLELAFRPDPAATAPVYRQLEHYLRDLIDAGRILPGEKLPASRDLSSQLEVSRNTVNHAYRRLLDEGVLAAHVGQGTFVAARPSSVAAARAGEAPVRGFAWEGLISQRSRHPRLPRTVNLQPDAARHNFLMGRVDPGQLPTRELRRAFSTAASERLAQIANPEQPFGWGPLREEISLLLVARGIACEPEDVLVTSGAQQALGLLAHCLVDWGDAVAMEDPGYFGAAESFRARGARLIPIPVDEHGLRTDELARVLGSERIKLVYTTPSAQCPTGARLSEERRAALMALSDEHQLPIVEDDYDSELRFAGPSLPALKTQDPVGRVVYLGTFSKALFPGLRIGYVVAAPPLLARLAIARWTQDFSSDSISQAAVAELLATGALERHLRRARRTYARRLAAMDEALRTHLPADLHFRKPAGGHAFWLRLPAGVSPSTLARCAADAGVAYVRGESFSTTGTGGRFRDCVALSFANLAPDAIDAGVRAFVAALARARTEES